MVLPKEKKKEIVKELREIITKFKAILFVSFQGVKAPDILRIRREFKKQGSNLKVVKKTLLIKAFEFEGKEEFVPRVEEVKTQFALALDPEDPVKISKLVYKAKKEVENFQPLGGIIEGKFYQQKEIEELSKLPSLAELRGQLVGVLAGNITSFLRVLKGPQESLVFLLKKYQEKVSSKS